jgi:hypothetical protein
MGYLYRVNSFPMSTGAPASVSIGSTVNTLKTILQLATPASTGIRVVEWGVSFEAQNTTANPCKVDLVDTGSVAATVTAHVAAGVQPWGDPNAPASSLTLGTTATGYNSTAEGTVTTSRTGDAQFVLPAGGQSIMQYPLGREFVVGPSRILRVRVTTSSGTTVPAPLGSFAYVIFEE